MPQTINKQYVIMYSIAHLIAIFILKYIYNPFSNAVCTFIFKKNNFIAKYVFLLSVSDDIVLGLFSDR